jgi:hypothetical protein
MNDLSDARRNAEMVRPIFEPVQLADNGGDLFWVLRKHLAFCAPGTIQPLHGPRPTVELLNQHDPILVDQKANELEVTGHRPVFIDAAPSSLALKVAAPSVRHVVLSVREYIDRRPEIEIQRIELSFAATSRGK